MIMYKFCQKMDLLIFFKHKLSYLISINKRVVNTEEIKKV